MTRMLARTHTSHLISPWLKAIKSKNSKKDLPCYKGRINFIHRRTTKICTKKKNMKEMRGNAPAITAVTGNSMSWSLLYHSTSSSSCSSSVTPSHCPGTHTIRVQLKMKSSTYSMSSSPGYFSSRCSARSLDSDLRTIGRTHTIFSML